MTKPAPDEHRSLSELVALVPVFLVPITWWLAWRALQASRHADAALAPARQGSARRLGALAFVDTVIGGLVLAAKLTAVEPGPPSEPFELEPLSPFEPVFSIDCRELWRDQLAWMLWPVVVGCVLVGLLWLRARRGEGGHPGRWGLVLVPMALAPLVGIGTSHAACERIGGWSAGVGLLGVMAQGVSMLVLGGLAMWVARRELRVVVGTRLPVGQATGVGTVYMLAVLVRIALLVFAIGSLTPELHRLHEGGLDVMLAGERSAYGRGLVLVAAVLVAPPAEEVLFRGLLLPGLAQSMPTHVALLVSAFVFGLFHVPSHGVAAVLPGILGLAFGWARLRSGSLRAPIALHVANNLLVTLLSWSAS